MSDAAFTDSTTAAPVSVSTRAPISGSSTNTRSPSSSWAWSEMPTRTRPSSSRRAHSWDLRNFRSPGMSLMAWFLSWVPGNAGESDAFARLAVAHEGVFHPAQRDFATADVHFHLAQVAGRHTGEAGGFFQGGCIHAGQDLALAGGGQDLLAVAQHATGIHDHTHHAARHALGLLFLQGLAADEVAAFVQGNRPAQIGLPGGDVRIHVL